MDFHSPFAGLGDVFISLNFMRLKALGKRTIRVWSPLFGERAMHTCHSREDDDLIN